MTQLHPRFYPGSVSRAAGSTLSEETQGLLGFLVRDRPVECEQVQPRQPSPTVTGLALQSLCGSPSLLLQKRRVHQVECLRRHRRHGTGADDVIGMWKIEDTQDLQFSRWSKAEEWQVNRSAMHNLRGD